MELWDLYDRDGNLTGKTWDRADERRIPDGYYHMVCDILVRHKDGDFLLMQRDFNKEPYPGRYEASAGGSALAGEDPLTCAKRELLEETGISSDSYELISHTFSDKSNAMFYSYLTEVDCDKDCIVLQEGETIAYKWVSLQEMLEHIKSDEGIASHNRRYEPYYRRFLKNGEDPFA